MEDDIYVINGNEVYNENILKRSLYFKNENYK
jgi:hypothetical protein